MRDYNKELRKYVKEKLNLANQITRLPNSEESYELLCDHIDLCERDALIFILIFEFSLFFIIFLFNL